MSSGRRARILIIEDEELICWSLKKTFERNEEYSVSFSYNGDDALRDIIDNHYDVVITDLRLPGVSGLELLEEIMGLIEDTPVIVMSAYFTDPAMIGITEYNVFRCVNKPFDIRDILIGVRDAVECKGGADRRVTSGY